jgi:hypothetical protein
MRHAMRAKFGLSLSTRAVLFGWGTLDDLLTAAQTAEASGYFDGVWLATTCCPNREPKRL